LFDKDGTAVRASASEDLDAWSIETSSWLRQVEQPGNSWALLRDLGSSSCQEVSRAKLAPLVAVLLNMEESPEQISALLKAASCMREAQPLAVRLVRATAPERMAGLVRELVRYPLPARTAALEALGGIPLHLTDVLSLMVDLPEDAIRAILLHDFSCIRRMELSDLKSVIAASLRLASEGDETRVALYFRLSDVAATSPAVGREKLVLLARIHEAMRLLPTDRRARITMELNGDSVLAQRHSGLLANTSPPPK
jgi:hypothetical protein